MDIEFDEEKAQEQQPKINPEVDDSIFKTPAEFLAPKNKDAEHVVAFTLKSVAIKHSETPYFDAADSEVYEESKSKQKIESQERDIFVKQQQQDLVYKQPVWSGVCSSDLDYTLEILKNGTIIDRLSLTEKPFYVFGRQLNCDFHLEHPSISRHHAVLQYRTLGERYEVGWYLYDMASTHGTFVNKERIPPNMYMRVRVGYVLKFGGSTRMYILQGPDEDMEKESLLTVTEIKQRADKQRLALKLATIKNKTTNADDEHPTDESSTESTVAETEENVKAKEKDTGINWGMSDDYASNDEEDDEENIDEGESINFDEMEKREQFYVEDPRKALKNFFDREGVELKYEFNEKGSTFKRQWCCRIELPVETNQGRALFAEVTVSGGKKEAYAACALEACRMLDAYGVLRKSNQESKKRKLKSYEENDFYDSDEDTFLDRTGELERKREKRKRQSADEPQVDNFESLNNKLNRVEEDIQRIQRQLLLIHAEIKSEANKQSTVLQDRDPLDSYMSEMSNTGSQEAKVQSSRLRLKLVELKTEAERLKKLIKITTPIAMPPLASSSSTVLKTTGGAVVGKKLQPVLYGSLKNRTVKSFLPPQPVQSSTSATNFDVQDQTIGSTTNARNEQSRTAVVQDETRILEKVQLCEQREMDEKVVEENVEKTLNNAIPPSNVEITQVNVSTSARDKSVVSVDDNNLEESLQQAEPELKVHKKRDKSKKDCSKTDKLPEYDSSDPDYAVWLPPDNQTGDGRTSLNEKLGY